MASKGKQFRKRARDGDDSGEEDGGARLPPPPMTKRAAVLNTFGAVVPRSSGTAAGATVVAELSAFSSTRSAAPHEYGGGAFSTTEVDTASDRDGLALLQKKVDLQDDPRTAVGAAAGPREYRGLVGYSDFIPKDAAEAKTRAKVSGTLGPLRAPANVRGICRIDYQPDICKDYKETGYCGFGDSCKFLHDRGDYKSGWQIDRDWDAEQARKRKALESRIRGEDFGDAEGGGEAAPADPDNPYLIADGDDEEGEGVSGGSTKAIAVDGDNLPFACHLCRGPFVRPVVTLCGHYFCEPCAVARYASASACAVCGAKTQGIFNTARKLEARLRLRASASDRADSAAAAGVAAERVESDEDGSAGGWGDLAAEEEAVPHVANAEAAQEAASALVSGEPKPPPEEGQ